MAYKNISKMLSDYSKMITMFVPNEDAFTYMPSHRANLLRDPDVLREVSGCKGNKDWPNQVPIWYVECICHMSGEGAQWLSGRVLDSRGKGHGFEPH